MCLPRGCTLTPDADKSQHRGDEVPLQNARVQVVGGRPGLDSGKEGSRHLSVMGVLTHTYGALAMYKALVASLENLSDRALDKCSSTQVQGGEHSITKGEQML